MFKTRGTEPIDGANAVVLDFREVSTPTLVMNSSGSDVPCSGTLWIDSVDGHVLKTRLVLTGYDGRTAARSWP